MKKSEMKQCAAIGCHEKRDVNIVFYSPDNSVNQEILWCHKHFLQYIGYLTTFFTTTNFKEDIFEGISLYQIPKSATAKS